MAEEIALEQPERDRAASQDREKEEEEGEAYAEIGPGPLAPAAVVERAVQEEAEREAGIGQRLEEIVAEVQRAGRETPGHVEAHEAQGCEQPARVARADPGHEGGERRRNGGPPQR